MQRICKFLIVILFSSIAMGCVGTDKAVKIPDPGLESAIRYTIGKLDAPIYVKDLRGLTELDAHGSMYERIYDITGLEYCTNLKVLDLHGNKITNIKPLSKLVNLERLYLSSNNITDISPLSKLVNLKVLDLNNNKITNIAPLSKLVNLEYLNFYGNKITDIEPLSKLANLEELNLQYNNITDISPLSKLVNLKKLYLDNNKITDIEPLVRNSGLSGGDPVSLGDDLLRMLSSKTVSLGDNPLSSKSRNVYIPELKQRGLLVQY